MTFPFSRSDQDNYPGGPGVVVTFTAGQSETYYFFVRPRNSADTPSISTSVSDVTTGEVE